MEDLGVKIFENNILKLHAKAIVCKSRGECELPVFKLRTQESAHDGIFSSAGEARDDHHINGDSEMVDEVDLPLVSSTCPMNQRTFQDTRKRKDGRMAEKEVPMKFLKFNLHENSVRCQVFQTDNRIDVDNPIYGGDTLEMEH